MSPGPIDSLENLSPAELAGLVRGLIGEVERLREANEKQTAALAAAKLENQQLKDEIRRLKGLPPRPPMKPSGMEKATDRPAAERSDKADASPPRRRGPGVSKLSIDCTVTLTASAPAGSRLKGYDEIIVQDVTFKPEVTLYRRERWTTPDGRTVAADLPAGVVGGCGPQLHRLILMLHFQGQMTCERIVAALTAAGLAISKRQVVRLLIAKLDLFRAEEEAAFSVGLRASGYVSVDDTGARHAGKAYYTTQFGSDRFTAFRTGPSKSRLAFLRNLLGGTARYAINAAAEAYMRAANLAHGVIDALTGADVVEFGSEAEWMAHLAALGLTELHVAPDPVRVASEAALWGAIAAEDRLGGAVILSDDAGQFRVGDHALCWVHAERLVYKLIPANDRQGNAIEITRRMIWWFYRQLKAFKLAPSPAPPSSKPASTASSNAEPDTQPSTDSSSASTPTRTNSCACSSGPKSRSTPTPPKTTSAPSSPNGKSQAERSATAAASPATSCSASPRPAPNSKSRSSTTSAPASGSPDRTSRPS